ncbi:N-acetyltransferase family protein [Bacillus salipaludis]|uniref:Arsinothricin resistance N-acetyltransferase ArsN1 n=1 Tax=Bacillus salipaludis TaxID=2547811 RepID=A0A4R5VJB7_9BACI|nr:arsinothricin resistance N-acetyltransferase ArsN1 family A [Bacillus salipaludis]MDQ6598041.1 arsinothricin resistance N-acetyltransferase ArsN1 [Bacillus salipaludis]TDK54211.1 N-acetyltransferase family protein [Bacillus salipaludis]
MKTELKTRLASVNDLASILYIYNQGIEDKIATLEEDKKDIEYMNEWFKNHNDRFAVIVVEKNNEIIGWASLNPYSNRCAYAGVADLSIYIKREYRGKGIGSLLLKKIEQTAIKNNFNKIVLFTFPFNQLGQGLYRKNGFREVGVFKNQGKLNGRLVDVMIMEKVFEMSSI